MQLKAISKKHLTYIGCESLTMRRDITSHFNHYRADHNQGSGYFILAIQTGCSAPGCKCTVLSTGVLMPFQPMAEKASHPVLGTVWSLTARPDEHDGAVKWQRACAAWIGKSGCALLGDTEGCF
jgi:hypothetical protein